MVGLRGIPVFVFLCALCVSFALFALPLSGGGGSRQGTGRKKENRAVMLAVYRTAGVAA